MVLENRAGPLIQTLTSSEEFGIYFVKSGRDNLPLSPVQFEDGEDKMCTTLNLQKI